MASKFNVGDKVVLKDYEFIRNNRGVKPDNEYFTNWYNYVKSKEPLELFYVYEPGEYLYGEEDDHIERRGQPTEVYYYNIQTPRSKVYLLEECEIEKYTESEE